MRSTLDKGGNEPKNEVAEPMLGGLKLSLWLSVLAFVISVVGAIYQALGYITGPDAHLIAPRAISFWYLPVGPNEYLSLNAVTMSYENRGHKDYDALVLEEYALVSIPGRTEAIRLDWWSFMGGEGEIVGQAHPEIVPGAGVANHETRMNPILLPCPSPGACSGTFARKNFLSWATFLSAVAEQKQRYIDIQFVAKIRNRDMKSDTANCRAKIDDQTFEQFVEAAQIAKMAVANSVRYDSLKTRGGNDPRIYIGLTCTYENSL